jgi:PAS domain S-box-containing protein
MKPEIREFDRSKQQMEEAEQTLHAIRQGAVDAFVVEEPEGHRVYALDSADLPYGALVERMQQGAAMLNARGDIIYCNPSLAQLFGTSPQALIGAPLLRFVYPADQPACVNLLQQAGTSPVEAELGLRRGDGTLISASFSLSPLTTDKSAIGVLITDLTGQKQQMEFASRLQQMQDDERRRIARELHDSVGQLLAAIGMNLSVVQSQANRLDATAARAVSENAALVDEVSREIRTISHLLHPPLLDVAGLASALRWYVDGFAERSKIKVDLDISPDFPRLSEDMEIAIFRIIQECLTNIHRHSGSATAAIRVHQEGDRVAIRVKDDGKGISEEKQREMASAGRGGVGLGGMRERLRQLGGTLEIQSSPSGTVVSSVLRITA